MQIEPKRAELIFNQFPSEESQNFIFIFGGNYSGLLFSV